MNFQITTWRLFQDPNEKRTEYNKKYMKIMLKGYSLAVFYWFLIRDKTMCELMPSTKPKTTSKSCIQIERFQFSKIAVKLQTREGKIELKISITMKWPHLFGHLRIFQGLSPVEILRM